MSVSQMGSKPFHLLCDRTSTRNNQLRLQSKMPVESIEAEARAFAESYSALFASPAASSADGVAGIAQDVSKCVGQEKGQVLPYVCDTS